MAGSYHGGVRVGPRALRRYVGTSHLRPTSAERHRVCISLGLGEVPLRIVVLDVWAGVGWGEAVVLVSFLLTLLLTP